MFDADVSPCLSEISCRGTDLDEGAITMQEAKNKTKQNKTKEQKKPACRGKT